MRLPRGGKVLEQKDGVALVGLPVHPRKRYPVWRIDALEEDIRRAEENIRTFRAHIEEQEKVIEERRQQISVCEERDRAITQWERDRANSDFPPGDEDHPGAGS